MSCLVQQIAWIGEPRLVDDEGAVADGKSRQQALDDIPALHRQTDAADECDEPLGDRIGEPGIGAGHVAGGASRAAALAGRRAAPSPLSSFSATPVAPSFSAAPISQAMRNAAAS